ncbi:MAG: hypothetical protein B7Z37_08680 [Verrucomicrobia bacterium 12-59-8]|nr:MAG: hypothetical protein B7Z37_08680 [Verrucomicrobia bacterium 12-59-8]
MRMKMICSALMICCLSGCYVFDANLPRPKAEYGQRTEQTIVVTAGSGFRKPGIHHVPRGTTLRQFMKIAQILPNRDWGPEEWYCGCTVKQMRDGKGAGIFSQAEPSKKQYETRLEDGAEVAVPKWNW